ncbi:MAG: hypothetical protein GY754_14510 [bacterium]|nr:hypothetical protein [bacterium]
MKRLSYMLPVLVLTLFFSMALRAQETAKPFGLRAAVGTDINLGIGGGIGAGYTLFFSPGSALEMGGDFFYHYSYEKNADEDTGNTFDEETELMIFAVRASWLFGYHPNEGGFFFIAGVGVVVASIDWTKYMIDKVSSAKSEANWLETTSAGNLFSLGVGYAIGNGLEVRLELPLLIFYSAGDAAAIAPTLTFSVEYRVF